MPVSDEPKKLSKKQRLLIIFAPITVALVSVGVYRFYTSHALKEYVLFGVVSVIINLIFTSCVVFINKDEFLEVYGNYAVIVASILTLIIPFFTYYVLFSLVFSGFQFPFSY
jgi:chromate transport protein ChrA